MIWAAIEGAVLKFEVPVEMTPDAVASRKMAFTWKFSLQHRVWVLSVVFSCWRALLDVHVRLTATGNLLPKSRS